MATCCAYRISQDKGFYSISGGHCEENAIWNAYYSESLGIYLFPDHDHVPATSRGMNADGYKRIEYLVDNDGVRHYYENHGKDDLIRLPLCYFHLSMLKGYKRPTTGWFFPKGIHLDPAVSRLSSRNLESFSPYGTIVIMGNKTIRTDFTTKMVPASRTSAQKSHRCCSMLDKPAKAVDDSANWQFLGSI